MFAASVAPNVSLVMTASARSSSRDVQTPIIPFAD
jgi:hypothetical protein